MSEPEPGLFNFTSVPDGYRRYLQPVVFDPWARKLLAFAAPSLGGRGARCRGGDRCGGTLRGAHYRTGWSCDRLRRQPAHARRSWTGSN